MAAAIDTVSTGNSGDQPSRTNFFDLPQEVRDLVYLRHPGVAWIDLTLAPTKLQQPVTSRVCRRMRKESLDIFYGRNNFMLDMRGWKHSALPKSWTPLMIFEHWVMSIGDHNVARLRSLSFYSHNFNAHIKVQGEENNLTLKFRVLPHDPQPVQTAPPGYNLGVAGERASSALRHVLDEIERAREGQPLNADDLVRICSTIELLQPFLCKRNALGWLNAILPSSDMDEWPETDEHLNKCDDCGYHRITRGGD